MARRSIIIGALITLFAFAAGIFIGRGMFSPADDPTLTTARNLEAIVYDQRPGQTELRSFEEVRSDDAPRTETSPTPKPKGFAFYTLSLDTTDESPRACFRFTKPLDMSGETNYADYVNFEPEIKAVAEPVDDRLCLSGLAFDKDYTATLREGLPGAEGEALASSEKVAVAFGDKPPFVGFVGDGVILPRMEADGIGIETVNVDTLKVKMYRVGDRALSFKQIVEGSNNGEDEWGGYAYSATDGQEYGVPIYDGEIAVKGTVNQRAVTVFPLGAAIGKARQEAGDQGLKPGAYYISLEDGSDGARRRAAQAWRWVMFTDMALTAYRGNGGIDVIVRSLETARPMANVDVTLIAANNDVLATAQSDGDGLVRFPGPATKGEGYLRPKMIMAYGGKDDFSVIDLQRSPLDLSDSDVSGRNAGEDIDGYIYFDRGIYRPGETVHIAGLLRDAAGNAVEGRPATVRLYRPNGTEADSFRLDTMSVGGFARSWEVPASAPRGSWRVSVQPDGSDYKKSASFSVEDFVPQRIAVTLKADEKKPIQQGEKRSVDVNARFLYGAPGSGLKVEGEARVRRDPNPFPDQKDFTWGIQNKSFSEKRLRLGETMTDGEGNASLSLGIDKTIVSDGYPLRADIVVGVAEPGGRFVNESARIPVRVDERYIGIRKSKDQRPGDNDPRVFDLVMLDKQGQQVAAKNVEWKILEEDYTFHWYRQNGEWRWRRDYRDIVIATDTVNFSADKLSQVSRELDYGAYRLEVEDKETGAKAMHRFYSGWRSYASGANTPDKAVITVPEENVKPGSRTKITLAAPYSGEAVITVATDRVHSVQRVTLDGKPREISIETDANWGAGFYVMATVVTPRDAVSQPVPRRAMGVAYVPMDMSARVLSMELDMPEMVRPRQSLDLPIVLSGAQGGEDVMITVAAVDEGILRLTKFQSPEPDDYYFGKKRLGVSVYDDYGRLLNPNLAAATKFGGDSLGGEGLSVVPTKSVALFSGVVKATGSGRVDIPIEVPDFNGELRLMVVAWSKSRLGSAAQALTVRDAVPAEIALPRFLAPGDQANATLLIDNVDGEAGAYSTTLTATGPVALAATRDFTLAEDERQDATFPLTVGDTGISSIKLDVSGPGDFAVSRSYPIQSRAPWFPVTQVTTTSQEADTDYKLTDEILKGYLPGSLEVKMSYSPLKGIDPQALLDSLYRYPYGCTEQLTSTAWPLLYTSRLGGLKGEGPDREVRPRVQKAINKILTRQNPDGAFGLWRVGDRYATGWVGAYVTDFLTRAKAEGYSVPQTALDAALKSMEQMTVTDRWVSVGYTFRFEEGNRRSKEVELYRRQAAAYSFYVLARNGKADLSDLRYFHDQILEKLPDPLSRMQIGAALAMMGDQSRAANAFDKAKNVLGYENRSDYYQSSLRDNAAMVAIASEIKNQKLVDELVDAMNGKMRDSESMNTQQKVFVLLAVAQLIDQAGDIRISVDGAEAEDFGKLPSFVIDPDTLSEGISFKNVSAGTVYRSLSVYGVPISAPPATNAGFKISKTLTDLNGKSVNLSNLKQNDRVIVQIEATPQDYLNHASIVVDMLPAGLEIETILRPEDTDSGAIYSFVKNVSPTKVAEARDDRFVAALDLRAYKDKRSTRSGRANIAYIARVVTPGEFAVPGAIIEDMYRPGLFARTGQQRMTVQAAE